MEVDMSADLCWPGNFCPLAVSDENVQSENRLSADQTGNFQMLTGTEPRVAPMSVCPPGSRRRSHTLTTSGPGAVTDLHTDQGYKLDRWLRQAAGRLSVPMHSWWATLLVCSISSRRKVLSAELPRDVSSCWKHDVTWLRASWARSHSLCCRRQTASSSPEQCQQLMLL